MNTEMFNVPEEQASSFLDQFLSGDKIEIQQQDNNQQKPIVEGNTEAITQGQENEEVVEKKEGEENEEGRDDEIQNLVKGKESEEEKPKSNTVPEKLFEELHKQGLIYPYEDGTKPQSIEEITDALKQSNDLTIQEKIEDAWNQKMSSLSPSIQTILQYAESGVATAKEIQELTQNISYYEKVSEFDVSKPQDQEQIVFLHLVNTGFSPEEAQEQVDLFRDNKTLDKTAQKFHPSLKKMYENQIKEEFAEKQAKEEDLGRYVQTNATNTSFFLNNEQAFLPFKLSRNHKSAVMELAAKPLGVDENYEPIFGYQQYLKQLQNGTEDQYKEFMEFMTFLADRKSYKEKLGNISSSKTAKDNFKAIAVSQGKVTNKETQQESYQGPVIRKQSSSAWSM